MAAARLIKATLSEIIARAETTKSFRFNLSERIDFIPGQFLQVIFDEPNQNNKELNKYLSFSSPPDRDYIEITKRLSQSQFSERLKALRIGDQVLLKAPLGNCVFKDSYQRIAFLIGGIGITPVISILGYIIDKKLGTDVKLFYSNKTEDDIAFKKELDAWQVIDNKIKVFYTVTDCPPKSSSCIFGRIDNELLINMLSDYRERIIFIFGPPKMVEAMQALCLETGCQKENVKVEQFIGY